MGNLILRVAFALSIVAVAIGMTAAASDTVGPCNGTSSTACAQAAPAAQAVAGYQAAPLTDERAAPAAADRATRAVNTFAQEATGLVILATALVFLSIFAILFGYRQRPGGVRASER